MKLFYVGFGLNVIFSLFCAYELFFYTDAINAMLLTSPLLLKLLAFGLVLFAGLIAYNLLKPRLNLSVIISLMDLGWIIVTVLLAIIFRNQLGQGGFELIMGVNGVIAVAMITQYYSTFALLKHPDANASRQYYLNLTFQAQAPKAKFWRVLSVLSDIHRYSPGIYSSDVEGGYGVGAKRVCSTCPDQEGKRWTEEVYKWNEGESFAVKFDDEAEGFPFPLRQLVGGWKVDDAGEGTTVSVWFEFNPAPSRLIVPFFLFLDKIFHNFSDIKSEIYLFWNLG